MTELELADLAEEYKEKLTNRHPWLDLLGEKSAKHYNIEREKQNQTTKRCL